MIVATTNDLPGYRVIEVLGLVRGITVRSRNVFGTIGGALQSIVGGNITIFTTLAETTRQQALDLMVQNYYAFAILNPNMKALARLLRKKHEQSEPAAGSGAAESVPAASAAGSIEPDRAQGSSPTVREGSEDKADEDVRAPRKKKRRRRGGGGFATGWKTW